MKQRGKQHALSASYSYAFLLHAALVYLLMTIHFSDCLGTVSTTVWMCKTLNQRAKLHWKELANISWNMLHFSASMSSKQKAQTHMHSSGKSLYMRKNETMCSKTWARTHFSLLILTHHACVSPAPKRIRVYCCGEDFYLSTLLHSNIFQTPM